MIFRNFAYILNQFITLKGSMKIYVFTIFLISLIFTACKNNDTPEPFGAFPSERQMDWHKMDYYAFIHFNINTFSDLEWGHGNEDPTIFNPTQLDCRQWAKVCKEAGMEGIIITAKHHDGFCLWPSAYTEHCVKNSPWKNGKGDLLKELSEACKEFDLKMGVYLSPWDRNNPLYGTEKYNEYFIKQLTEVLTGYGEIFEVWFDGANGEGPNGKKQEYDWDGFIAAVRKHQPNAVIFSDSGPDIRWIGNERGFAKQTNWNTLNRENYYPGTPDYKELTEGNKNGTHWLPAEVNVSIRPGWYYHEEQDDDVKSVDHLEMIYYNSVGRGSNFLLNLPVDRRGLIHENEIQALSQLKKRLDDTFLKPVPFKIPISLAFTPSYLNVGEPTKYLLDDDLNTYWSSRDDVTSASFEIALEKGQRANIIEIAEYISLGQRVESFEIDALIKGRWEQVAKGTTIGWKRLIRLPDLDYQRYRINITKTMASPVISNIKLFYSPHKNYLLETVYDFDKRIEWWRNDRFGMFIHWGAYALPGGEYKGKQIDGVGEWIMNRAQIPVKDYEQFPRQFNPVNFNPDEWVQIAKSAGMRYMVITSKHHDGFCLWDSKITDYDIMDFSPFKRDILKELSVACKKEGIKLGFYYSIMDWHHPDAQAPHYPIYNTGEKKNPNFQKYVQDYLKPQVKELIENYDPAILWFDGEWIPEWTHDNGLDMYQFVRSLKPEIIINNRVDKGRGGMQGMTKEDQPYAGDFGTPEQEILKKGGATSDWESCMTMNDTWGFKQNDTNWKSVKTLIHNLVDITSKGGNFLMNVGPDAKGIIPAASLDRLKEMGDWLKINGEAIFETRPFDTYTEGENVRYTQKANNLVYAIFLEPFSKEIILKNVIPVKDSKIFLLGYQFPLEWKLDSSNQLVVNIPATFDDPANLPCKYAWVLKIKIKQAFK